MASTVRPGGPRGTHPGMSPPRDNWRGDRIPTTAHTESGGASAPAENTPGLCRDRHGRIAAPYPARADIKPQWADEVWAVHGERWDRDQGVDGNGPAKHGHLVLWQVGNLRVELKQPWVGHQFGGAESTWSGHSRSPAQSEWVAVERPAERIEIGIGAVEALASSKSQHSGSGSPTVVRASTCPAGSRPGGLPRLVKTATLWWSPNAKWRSSSLYAASSNRTGWPFS